jgi:putative peptidoglycan lipid II flippase
MSKHLFKSTSLVGILTLITRIAGFMRENIFAIIFGATGEMDAFVIAFRIPNFLRKIFAEGAFSQAFIPVLTEVRIQKNHQELSELIARVSGTLSIILIGVTLLGIFGSTAWAALFAPSYLKQPDKFILLNHLLKIMFPYIFFIALTGLYSSVQNVFNRYAIPAATPLILSLCMGWAAVSLTRYFPNYPIEAVAYGILLAGLLQLLIQLPFIWNLRLLVRPKWGWHDMYVRRIVKMMLPALFGVSVAQIGMLIDSMYATFLPTGSVSWLYYADRLMQFPLGVFGIALATVVMPHLSRQIAGSNIDEFKRSIEWSLKLIFLIALPCAVGLAVLAGPILVTLFEYGKFNYQDMLMTKESLWAFSAGLFFFIMVKIAVSAFYSRQDMKTPMKVGIFAVLTNIILNSILIFPLKHVGLALATSIAAMVNTLTLLLILKKQNMLSFSPGWTKLLIAIVVANAAMAYVIFILQGQLINWISWPVWERVLHLTCLIIGGVGVYFLVLWLLGIRKHDFIMKDTHVIPH